MFFHQTAKRLSQPLVEWVESQLEGRFRLTINRSKTRLVKLGWGKDGFIFLGCTCGSCDPDPHTHPRTYCRRRWAGMSDIREVIREPNPVLRGWGGYFRTGNASTKFTQMDSYVRERLIKLLMRCSQRRWRPGGHPFRPNDWPHRRLVKEHGLYRLRGTLRYPGGTHAA